MQLVYHAACHEAALEIVEWEFKKVTPLNLAAHMEQKCVCVCALDNPRLCRTHTCKWYHILRHRRGWAHARTFSPSLPLSHKHTHTQIRISAQATVLPQKETDVVQHPFSTGVKLIIIIPLLIIIIIPDTHHDFICFKLQQNNSYEAVKLWKTFQRVFNSAFN